MFVVFNVVAIACGVGTATTIGAWRMKSGRPLLPQVYMIVTPVVLLMVYMMWIDTDLRSVIGLAFDCGAITTGMYPHYLVTFGNYRVVVILVSLPNLSFRSHHRVRDFGD